MSDSPLVVYLKNGETGSLVEAELHDSISQRHLEDYAARWKPLIAQEHAEHGHWDWRDKWAYFSTHLCYDSFAVACDGVTQGLMLVNTIKRCRRPREPSA